jgi:hypothetical protein
MKINGDYEVSDIPHLMRQWEDSGRHNWAPLLGARAALTDACGDLMDSAARESRGLNAGERRSFDAHMAQAREINAALAKIKAEKIAEQGAEQVHVPF